MTATELPKSKYEAARRWHLADTDRDASITDFEFSLLQALSSFERWALQGTRLINMHESLTFNEIILLHLVRMHDRPKDAATLAKVLNRDDLPNVLYSLRKLIGLGLVCKSKSGSVTLFEATESGVRKADQYAELRRDILVPSMESVGDITKRLRSASALLREMTGYFENAARETATQNSRSLFAEGSR